MGNSKPILLAHADLTLLTSIIPLAQDWDAIVREYHPEGFDSGLVGAVASGVVPLGHVATGLRADDDTVKAGMMLRRSDGSVEGHINRSMTLTGTSPTAYFILEGRDNGDIISQPDHLAACLKSAIPREVLFD